MDFVPFAPTSAYERMSVDTFFNHLIYAFQSVMKIPLGTVTTSFKDATREVLDEVYPQIPQCSLRALLENSLPDFPDMLVGSRNPPGSDHCIRHVVLINDFAEAVVQRFLQQKIQVHRADFRRNADLVKKVFGTVKVPGYMQAILGRV